MTLKEFLDSWDGKSGEGAYDLVEAWSNKKGDVFIIDVTTNSGFKVVGGKEVQIAVSGIYYNEYYGEEFKIKLSDEISDLFDKLVSEESINKDRFYNVTEFMKSI